MTRDYTVDKRKLLKVMNRLYDSNCINCKYRANYTKMTKPLEHCLKCPVQVEMEKAQLHISLADVHRRVEKGMITHVENNSTDTTVDYFFLELYEKNNQRIRKTLKDFRKAYKTLPEKRLKKAVVRLRRLGMVRKGV